MDKLLIFAGTYEGRVLCEFLSLNGINATASVATEYGEEIIQDLRNINVIKGRLNLEDMESLILRENYSKIIDATHPYAQIVSENIEKACETTDREYIRLLREEGKYEGLLTVGNTKEAVSLLNDLEGNILLTTGSKELASYKGVDNFEKRIFARVLPSKEVLESCENLGIKGRNLICMQGPFSKEMNFTMLKDYDCSILVTKNTGNAGGFREKVEAAKLAGAKVIVIDRPLKEGEEKTYSLEELKLWLATIFKFEAKVDVCIEEKNNFKYFPSFVDSTNKLVVIVGAGKIGLGRVEKLKGFNFKIKVVSEKYLYMPKGVECLEKFYEDEDINGAFMVVAATNNRDVNSHIGKICREKNILCSVADKGSEGSFIFPALIDSKEGLIAISSDGESPKKTKLLAKKLREILT
ncbi:MAG: precorrin-6A reductase [Filifactoraceae bacterium]